MPEFRPKKNDVLSALLYVCAIIVGFLLNIAGNIVYDSLIKSAPSSVKIAIVISGAALTGAIIYLVNEIYFKPLKKYSK